MNTPTNNNVRSLIASNPSDDVSPIDPSLVDALASQILTSLKGNGVSKGIAAAPATPAASAWLTFTRGLDALVKSNPDLVHALEAVVTKSARQVLASMDLAVPSADDFLKMVATTSKGSVQGYWWGVQFYLSHQDIQSFVPGATGVATVAGALGTAVSGPYAPIVGAVAAFIVASLALIIQLDHGRGVFISMSWFAPGAFVPTSA